MLGKGIEHFQEIEDKISLFFLYRELIDEMFYKIIEIESW